MHKVHRYFSTFSTRVSVGVSIFILVSIAINRYVFSFGKTYVHTSPSRQVERWIILWASVKHDGQLSPLSQQRVDQWYAAYSNWEIRRLLVSGYDAGPEYQEATSMAWYLLQENFPDTQLLIDGEGIDTYDSLWRAKNIHGIDSALIFTQWFHLARSLYIARKLWIEARGYPVDQEWPTALGNNSIREFFARIKAFIEIEFGSKK